MSEIGQNIARIQERIGTAAKRAGRDAASVALMAVSKTMPAERLRDAYQSGIRLFGENRVQEFEDKSEQLGDLKGARFHLIGHLQSNKAAKAASLFHAIDSIDSLRLAEKVNAAAENEGKKLPVLIEINVGGEEAKSGLAPVSSELEELLRAAERLGALEIRGLMTVPPFFEDPQQVRPYFKMLRELRDEIARRSLPDVNMHELSMGMSHDFEVAVEEGSTCVRVGTAIFGSRNPSEDDVKH